MTSEYSPNQQMNVIERAKSALREGLRAYREEGLADGQQPGAIRSMQAVLLELDRTWPSSIPPMLQITWEAATRRILTDACAPAFMLGNNQVEAGTTGTSGNRRIVALVVQRKAGEFNFWYRIKTLPDNAWRFCSRHGTIDAAKERAQQDAGALV